MKSAPRDAATVVLMRDGRDGLEVCLLQRSPRLVFAGGAHVFPGGVLDEVDRSSEEWIGGLTDDVASLRVGVPAGGRAFWVAAVRECLEEAGVLPALEGEPDLGAGLLAAWRHGLSNGRMGLGEALAELGTGIDSSRLRCVARWVTSVDSPRRYDARFFLAIMPEGQSVDPDGHETIDHLWVTPTEALDRHSAGAISLIFPTVRTLFALTRFASAREAFELADLGDPAAPLLPEVVREGDRTYLVLHSDPEGNGGVYDWETGLPTP